LARFVLKGTAADPPGDSFALHLPDSLRTYVREIFPMPDSIPSHADVTGAALFERRVAGVR
jgi:hypothetical protein